MSDSITALGAQLAAAEAHVADLRARILGPSPIPSAEAPTGPLKAPLFGACEHGLNRLLGECPLCGLPPPPKVPLKLDLGCGPHKQEGHVGVDARQFPGVDVVADLAGAPWPWADGSVDSVHCSHMLEHVPGKQRIHFFNELWRVLKPAGTAQFITPHWASQRAYGDMTHEWPPVVPFFWAYLDKGWRATQAPHCDFVCDFTHVAMISPAPELNGRTQAYVEHAVKHDIDGGSDMHCTLTKRVSP